MERHPPSPYLGGRDVIYPHPLRLWGKELVSLGSNGIPRLTGLDKRSNRLKETLEAAQLSVRRYPDLWRWGRAH